MIHNLLKNKQVILASASPRRKEIFDFIGIKALILPAHIDEPIFTDNPRKLVIHYAEEKARQIKEKVENNCLIVAADTIVYHKKKIIGKPKNREEAFEILSRLSNDFHHVYTGIGIYYKNKIYSAVEKSKVVFAELDNDDIISYIKTKEPLDKAGAYGIQGFGSQFIVKISGCYFNVMGFPIHKFYSLLRSINL